MKKFTYFLTAAIVVALASCSTSNDVVSKNGIQKRKYNSGFYVDAKGKQTVDPIAEAKAKSANAAEWTSVSEESTTAEFVAPSAEASVSSAATVAAPAPIIVKSNPLARSTESSFSFKGFKRSFEVLKGDFASQASVYNSASTSAEPSTLVYILLILLVPFGTTISMYLYEGSWTKRVTVNLILSFLCIAGLIHACVIIFGNK